MTHTKHVKKYGLLNHKMYNAFCDKIPFTTKVAKQLAFDWAKGGLLPEDKGSSCNSWKKYMCLAQK